MLFVCLFVRLIDNVLSVDSVRLQDGNDKMQILNKEHQKDIIKNKYIIGALE